MRSLVLTLLLSTCVGVSGDAGCLIYGQQRTTMPTLGSDPVSQWVDVTDGAMTGGCT